MKLISLISILLLSVFVHGQDLPKIVNPTDTLIIKKDSVTDTIIGKSIWIQTLDSEVEQRFEIRTLQAKLSAIDTISTKIDTTTNSLNYTFNSILIQKDLQLNRAESTIGTLSSIVQKQSEDIHTINLNLQKEKKKSGFWKTTTWVLGTVSLTTIVLLSVQ